MSLNVSAVCSGYNRGSVLHDVDVVVEPGQVVAVLGSNGAGKSTLVRTIAGSVATREGTIVLDGESVERLRPEQRARRGLILVPEGRMLFSRLTVADNIAIARRAARGRAEGPDPVEALLDAFPVVRARWRQRAGLLSGGEQQMVALTRAVASRPRYLLLDEPSLGLSPLLVREVFGLVRHIVETTNAGVLLVEQSVDQALRLADQAYVLERGRVVESGSPVELRQSEAIRRAYLGIGVG